MKTRKCPLCGNPLSQIQVKDKSSRFIREMRNEAIDPPYVLVYHAYKINCNYVELWVY